MKKVFKLIIKGFSILNPAEKTILVPINSRCNHVGKQDFDSSIAISINLFMTSSENYFIDRNAFN